MTLEEAIAKIKPLDHNAMEIAQKRWESIEKKSRSSCSLTASAGFAVSPVMQVRLIPTKAYITFTSV